MKFKLLATLLFGVVGAVGVVLLDQKPSYAWLKICNNSSERIDVAFGYLNAEDNRNGGGGDTWIAQGWWNLQPSRCSEVYPHELWRRNSVYYYYAHTAGRGRIWSGDTPFCITNSRFLLSQTDQINSQCGGDITWSEMVWPEHGGGGSVVNRTIRGTYWQDFRRIDTGDNSNYTINIR
jgi:uncharacterized membrane protein